MNRLELLGVTLNEMIIFGLIVLVLNIAVFVWEISTSVWKGFGIVFRLNALIWCVIAIKAFTTDADMKTIVIALTLFTESILASVAFDRRARRERRK